MTSRIVADELLDQLPHDDPSAVRSRGDLRRINFMMGNFRWIRRKLQRLGLLQGSTPIVEIGAGAGDLAHYLHRCCPGLRYTAIDLAPRPSAWPGEFSWKRGDALSLLGETGGDVLVANLFLHHLTEPQLRQLGEQLANFKTVICSEPARLRRFHGLAYAGRILGFNHVTRHDIHVSIDAGFVGRELPDSLNLTTPEWSVDVRVSSMGAYRMIATRGESALPSGA